MTPKTYISTPFSHHLFTLSLLFISFLAINSQVHQYTIYKLGGEYTYPRPLLLHDGNVLALTGNSDSFSKYNRYGEVIFKDRKIDGFGYDSNAAVIQLFPSEVNGYSQHYVLAHAKITKD